MKKITPEAVLDAVTYGTTDHDYRDNPRYIRMRHFEPTFSLVQWVGGSVWSGMGGTSYVPGHVNLVRHPVDLRMLGGSQFWSTARDEHGVFTEKRLRVWLEVFRDRGYVDKICWKERITVNSMILRRVTRLTLKRCGVILCSGSKDGIRCTHKASEAYRAAFFVGFGNSRKF